MRYLRMLTNSVIAASLAAAYVLVLVLELNPTLPLAPAHVWPLVTTVGLYYTIHLTVVAYVMLVLRQIFARELVSPAWISVGVLVWFGAFAAAAGAALMWRNLFTFALVLDPASRWTLVRTAAALTLAAVLFLLIGAFRRAMPDARRVWAPLFVIVMVASIAVPVALRGPGSPPALDVRSIEATAAAVVPIERTARVHIVAIDGGSLDFITSATAEGRLPNFGKALDGGAVRHLATLHPTSAETVWAAVATGKLPQKNGVRSAGFYRVAHDTAESKPLQLLPEYCFAHGLVRLGFLVEEPHSSSTFRTQTLWSILTAHGITMGIVGWPLTQPAPAVHGFLVADTYHRAAETLSGLATRSALYPPDLQEEAVAAMEEPPVDEPSVAHATARDQREEQPARIDRMYERIAHTLSSARPTQVTFLRYQGLDPIGHYFLRFAMPSDFGDVTDEERRRLGGVLERHYAVVDRALGRAMAALGPDDLLLVVSPYGMVPLNFGRRLVERVIGDPDLNGTHDAAPDGFLIAYGGPIARGRHQDRASVVDVLPTLLYFLGLPIGRDMDGYVRTDLFKPAFTLDRPITYIPTHDR